MRTVHVLFTFTSAAFLFFASCFPPALGAPPPIQRHMEIVEATIDGLNPETVDPVACYDTASGELLMNCYDTLVFYDGERLDRYLPQLAREWTIENVTGLAGSHDNRTGLDWYYRYTFRIRASVPFQDASFGNLVPADVEYCFERGMILDMDGGPQWMFYEPLLNGASATFVNQEQVDPATNMSERAWVGECIDHAVESNASHVWFNLAYPGAYAPLLHILCQAWSSIYSKAWAISLGRPSMWPGTWDDYMSWWAYHNPSVAPLDAPTPAVMGTGPFVFANLDSVNSFWDAYRFTGYWRGWGDGPEHNYGVDWPAFGQSKPAGYVNHIVVSWAWDWATRSAKFLNGEVDFCAVPRQYIPSMMGKPNIRCMYPLPSIACDALFYNFNIDPSSPYGLICDYGVLSENGIPRDFFSDVNVRKAFSHCIDFATFIDTVYGGEAMQPPTALVPGLPYYNASIPKYDYNLSMATRLFQAAWGGSLWTTGFTIQLMYNPGNLARKTLFNMLKTALESLGNPKIHVEVAGTWQYTYARDRHQLSALTSGWLADYPDPHNFAYAFYYSKGNFAWRQAYSNPTMDALIDQGIRQSDGSARAAIYSAIQQLAIDDCPCVALDQGFGRHFEASWMNGWYYNPSYFGGDYFANVWKWYYTPHAQLDTVTNATANQLPYDLNYDGRTDMIDIGITAASFGAAYDLPTSLRWFFRCDFNNDRKIDMRDMGLMAKNFGKKSTPWTPAP